jgi:ribokinase
VGWQPAAGNRGVLLTVFEVGDEAVLAAALVARQLGMRICVNPAPARAVPAALAELAPILLPNEAEARALAGDTDMEAAARSLAEQTGAPVVVTVGADGALIVKDGTLTRIPAPTVEVVDTTGAGDAFAGAFAAELARHGDVLAAARFAVVAASLKVRTAGAREGLPTRAQVAELAGESVL